VLPEQTATACVLALPVDEDRMLSASELFDTSADAGSMTTAMTL
jgi:hypothetical protein